MPGAEKGDGERLAALTCNAEPGFTQGKNTQGRGTSEPTAALHREEAL